MKILLFSLSLTFLSKATTASTTALIKEGRSLNKVNTLNSKLLSGGTLVSSSTTSNCNTRKYHEVCTGGGTRVDTQTDGKGAYYLVGPDKVTYCGRYRLESNCNNCNQFTGCTPTNPVSHHGVTYEYNLADATNEVARLNVAAMSNACTGVCTDASSLVFALESRSDCANIQGWTAVNPDFDEPCATSKETCEKLHVKSACDGDEDLEGTYRLVTDNNPSDDCPSKYSSADWTRPVYVKETGRSLFIFYHSTKNEWVFNIYCNDLEPVFGYFGASANEPFVDTEAQGRCWDGGFGSQQGYNRYDLEIVCVQKTATGGGGGGSSATKKGLGLVTATMVSVLVTVIGMVLV